MALVPREKKSLLKKEGMLLTKLMLSKLKKFASSTTKLSADFWFLSVSEQKYLQGEVDTMEGKQNFEKFFTSTHIFFPKTFL